MSTLGLEQRLLAVEAALLSLIVSYATTASGNAANVITSVHENALSLADKVKYVSDEASHDEMAADVAGCLESIFARLKIHPAEFDKSISSIDAIYAEVAATNISLIAALSVLAPTAEMLGQMKSRAMTLADSVVMTADTTELNEQMSQAIEARVAEIFDGAATAHAQGGVDE